MQEFTHSKKQLGQIVLDTVRFALLAFVMTVLIDIDFEWFAKPVLAKADVLAILQEHLAESSLRSLVFGMAIETFFRLRREKHAKVRITGDSLVGYTHNDESLFRWSDLARIVRQERHGGTIASITVHTADKRCIYIADLNDMVTIDRQIQQYMPVGTPVETKRSAFDISNENLGLLIGAAVLTIHIVVVYMLLK